MKQNLTTIFIFLLSGFSIFAQIEQVSVGAGYSQQAYYKLSTGEVTMIPNEVWDVAFSNAGFADAGVLMNESATFMASPIKVFLSNEVDWSTPITDTSVFVDSVALYNPEENWTEGAFNTVRDTINPGDYGWGAYNPTTHVIEGTKIFVIQKRDGSFIKFQVQELAGGDFTFRYANLDGTNERTAVASKSQAGNSPLIYYSFSFHQFVDVPTDYDMVFQRYSSPLDDGSDTPVQYTVTGVLIGPNTQAVVADGVDPFTVEESDYAEDYSSAPSVIGHDWKSFSFSSGWIVDDDRAQFIRTSEGEIYKVIFFDFEGSSTGITTLEKTYLGLLSSTKDKVNDRDISVYPNPTSDILFIDDVTEEMHVLVFDGNGRLVLSRTVWPGKTTIDLGALHAGLYNVLVHNQARSAHYPVVITR